MARNNPPPGGYAGSVLDSLTGQGFGTPDSLPGGAPQQAYDPQLADSILASDPNSNVGVTNAADESAAAPTSNRARLSISGGAPGNRLYNQDFMPGGAQPTQSRSQQVGKYGGAPIFAPVIAAPFAVIDERLNANARREAELDAAMMAFDPMAGVQDAKAVRYRDSINSWAMDDIESYVQNIYDRYGEKKGLEKLRSKSSLESMELRKKVGHINSVVGSIDDAVNKAIVIKEGSLSGNIDAPPNVIALADDVIKKTGSFEAIRDPEELARILPLLQGHTSLLDQLKDDGTMNLLKEAGSTRKVFELVKGGDPLYAPRFSTLLSKKTVDRSAIVDSMVDTYVRKMGGVLPESEIRKTIEGMTPQMYEEDVERAAIPQSSSSSNSSGGAKESGYGSYYQYSSIPGTQGARKFHQVRLSHISAGKGKLAAPIPMATYQGGEAGADHSGEESYLHPVAVYEDSSGNLMIHGKVAKEPGVRVVEDEKGISFFAINPKTGAEESISETQYFNKLKDVSVPYSDNAGALESVMPGLNEQVIRQAIAEGKGGAVSTTPAQRTKATRTGQQPKDSATSTTARFYDNEKERPPVHINARWSAKHGMWLQPKPGGKPNEYQPVPR